MSSSFDRLIELYRGSYGEPALPAGAAAEDIDRVEAETGLQVPGELREILLRHDGTPLVPLLPDGAWFHSAEQMVDAWQAFGELADTENEELPPEPVETGTHSNAVHHRRRLPFATREDFELFIDYEPGPKGTPGQVLMQCNECDFALVGKSFADFLERWIARIETDSVRGKDPDYWRPKRGGDWGATFLAAASR